MRNVPLVLCAEPAAAGAAQDEVEPMPVEFPLELVGGLHMRLPEPSRFDWLLCEGEVAPLESF